MENNDNKNLSLLEILAKKSDTYNQELDARTNAITEGLIANQNHWDGTAKFSPTAIAKEKAANLKKQAENLVEYTKEKATPKVNQAAKALREKAIEVTKKVLLKLEDEK